MANESKRPPSGQHFGPHNVDHENLEMGVTHDAADLDHIPAKEQAADEVGVSAFDPIFYRAHYPDLVAAGLKSAEKLKEHCTATGAREGRVANFTQWLERHDFPADLFPFYPNWETLADLNDLTEEEEQSATDQAVNMVVSALLDSQHEDLVISEDPLEQGTFLYRLAQTLKTKGNDMQAARATKKALTLLSSSPQAIEENFSALGALVGFDERFYQEFYPDLEAAGVRGLKAQMQHYISYGMREGRLCSVQAWLQQEGLSPVLLGVDPDMAEIVTRTTQYGRPITWRETLETLKGMGGGRAWFAPNARENAEIYFAAAMALKTSEKAGISPEQRQQRSLNLLKIAASFDPNAPAILTELGHHHIAQGQNRIAAGFFEAALVNNPSDSGHEIVPHLIWMWRSLHEIDKAYELFERYLPMLRFNAEVMQQLDDFCDEIRRDVEERSYFLITADRRRELVEWTQVAVERQYRLYTLAMGGDKMPAKLGRVDPSRVLIVGDFFLPQCKRYRIDQKIEQLQAAGMVVKAVDWTKVGEHVTDLSFFDVVIFYRVPAVREVIKAIAQVNLSGRLSIYEIDDLLFDPIYPPSIDTYGSAVSLDQYAGLMRGMSLMRAAAKLCRVGMASTVPLQEWLAPVVRSGQCLLHRNGLDSANAVTPSRAKQVDPDRINIFYGSGTKAHNSDFIELALPALEKILAREPRARLIVAGYLELPKSFTETFADQLVRLPLTRDVAVYYGYLALADINLATLLSEPITDCKSELKWFEAAWYGVPSVVSDTRNYLDVVKGGEDGLIAKTPQDWERCIGALIEDEDLRRHMGEAARARVLSEYSVQALGEELRGSLEACVAQHAGPAAGKKRVAMVNVFFSPQSVGGATRVFEGNINGYLARHGEAFEPVIFTSNYYEGIPHQVQVEAYGNLRVYRCNIRFRPNMDWMPKDEKMAKAFRRFLETEKPDLVHFHCVQRLTASIVEITREMGIPYVITLHDAWWFSDHQFLVDDKGKVYPEGHPGEKWVTEAHPPEGSSKEEALSRHVYLHSLAESADRVFTVSNGFATICHKNGLPQTEVAANGIDPTLDWRPKSTGGRTRVVGAHVGGMSAHKGYDLLRAVVMRLQPKNMEFLIVNHAMPEGWVMHDSWGSVPVKFIGRTSQLRVTGIYAQSDVLFAPSIWPESFGLVTREAAACGCWIVASNLGAIGEDVIDGENGFVIDPTEAEMRRVLETIDANPEHYKGLAPFDHLRSADDQADQMAAVYGEVIAKKGE